jgi:hypothetical protein
MLNIFGTEAAQFIGFYAAIFAEAPEYNGTVAVTHCIGNGSSMIARVPCSFFHN